MSQIESAKATLENKPSSSHLGEMILIIDFGSQFTQLIARRVREAHVYCEIMPCTHSLAEYANADVRGYILSGGPSSLTDAEAPRAPEGLFETDKPILGVCYGMQLIADEFGAKLEKSSSREYGKAELSIGGGQKDDPLFSGLKANSKAWMSHGDSIVTLPDGFETTASTDSLTIAAFKNLKRNIFGVQFHPEVSHTEEGRGIINNFLTGICNCSGDWTDEKFIDTAIASIREKVGDGKVVLGISGGVDSSVAAMLLHRAIGDRLYPIFVDNGLLRKDEFTSVMEMFEELEISVTGVDATKLFMERLSGVSDPEKKRKIIGAAFIDIFEEESEKIGGVDFLAQGTLYPDVIESVSFKGPSVTIKSHHNVGGLKDRMKLKLVEPLRELFKDEVRSVGVALGLAPKFLARHPFPGPGLAVRILGDITDERRRILREADAVFIEELYSTGQYDLIWQAFAVLLPIRTVGVMGDERTYEHVIALRAVTSLDGMTADWARIPGDILAKISNRIINEVSGVNRVTYDISSKPPATIEWE